MYECGLCIRTSLCNFNPFGFEKFIGGFRMTELIDNCRTCEHTEFYRDRDDDINLCGHWFYQDCHFSLYPQINNDNFKSLCIRFLEGELKL